MDFMGHIVGVICVFSLSNMPSINRETAKTIFQDSSQERWELEALRQKALSSLDEVTAKKPHIDKTVLMHAEFLSPSSRRWKVESVGVQANWKDLDEVQLEGKEGSRVQCEGAGGGRLEEALMEVRMRIGPKMWRVGVGVKEVKSGTGKEQMTSTSRKPALNLQVTL